MDTNKNSYTLVFVFILITVVSVILSFTSLQLKPLQKDNIQKEKMQNILSSIGINVTANEAEKVFNEQLIDQFIFSGEGQKKEVEGKKAFDIDVLKEYKGGLSKIYREFKEAPPQEMVNALLTFDNNNGANYPLFVCKGTDGKANYVIPVVGKGLWGPIWGYIALGEDKQTIVGVNFDHKTETPGLGAEIKEKFFQEQWIGKKVFDSNNNFTSVAVVKGGTDDSNPHGVDAISGGTITSVGVDEMVRRTLKIYEPFLKN